LKKSTLKTLLDGDGDRPPVLPPGSYTHNKAEKTIRIKGGGEILYFGMDDPGKLGSLNLTGIATDELVQFTRDDWTWMQGRARVPIDGLPNQLYGATNPGAPSHWLVELFGLALGHRPKPGYRVIRTRTTDNPSLPRDYVDTVRDLPGVAYKRFFLGEWAGADGLVYDTFDREKHVRVRSGPWKRTILGIDEGYTNPFVVLVGRIDGDGRLHIEAEHYESKLVRDQKVEIVRRLSEGAESVMVDPSAAELIETLHNAGVPVKPADNDIDGGCHRVRARLADPGDGKPRLTADPACENLVREFESYEYKPDTDKPKKEFDHAMDALRYLVAEADGPEFKASVLSYREQQAPMSVTLTGDYGWVTA
jgi:phage terminase large subunit